MPSYKMRQRHDPQFSYLQATVYKTAYTCISGAQETDWLVHTNGFEDEQQEVSINDYPKDR